MAKKKTDEQILEEIRNDRKRQRDARRKLPVTSAPVVVQEPGSPDGVVNVPEPEVPKPSPKPRPARRAPRSRA